ncbi:iron complex outermembrane receptor protein/hemoglobin/transferrin/lactoferrin receptor protein [Desulfobotulus alkaliphilus]|uniref:Iron complex outermembrane receptor protein/hemoglobin/transferrin/lactoferrin receptor protein n=1 Tax=Desulfobotulus alkaliphilus TaxID=622671 RepID=A0A562S5U2_9BACT|nr:TonB-dependent receptor [Desulfobotulus alkaliphilus]TWI76709.1 iron complex outermembrane receptor protein/hemoglobin/transferrin/lactoferrin receptor protein [Desulfobotulus alkaliphilus]
MLLPCSQRQKSLLKTKDKGKKSPVPWKIARALGLGLTLTAFAFSSSAMEKEKEDTAIAMSEVTVIGTRIATDVQKYPGSVTVLGEEDLKSSSTVIEAMTSIPGVTTGGDSGRAMGQQFNIRGFGYQSEDRVIILQDGVRRSASLFSNQISTFRSDNDLLKRIEVVKGASSGVHGSGAIGGVGEMGTKDAYDFMVPGQNFGMATKFRYEDNNYREGYVAFAAAPEDQKYEMLIYGKKGQHGDRTLAKAYSAGNDTSSKKVDNDEDLRILFIKGGYNFTDASKLTLSYYDFSKDSKVTWQSLWHTSYSTVTGPVIGTLTQRDMIASFTHNPNHSPWLDFGATVYRADSSYDRGFDSFNARGEKDKLDYENKDERWGLRLRNQMHFSALTASNRLLVGADFEKREEDAIYVRNGTVSDFGSMPNTYEDMGYYAHLESSFFDDILVLQASGRFDSFDRKVKGGGKAYSGDHFSPRIGFSARLFEGFHLLGNYSESFRAPTPHETSSEGPLNRHYWYLPNADLKPEIAKEFEGGFSYTRRNILRDEDRFRFKAMYFDGKIEDMINLAPDHDGPRAEDHPMNENAVYATYKNIDSVSREGYELSASYDAFRAGFSASFSHLNMTDDATGKKAPQAFADKVTFSAYARPLHSLKISTTVHHWLKPDQNPETLVSGGTTHWYVRDSYTQANFLAAWTPDIRSMNLFAKDLEILVGVNNAFDQAYINARDVETTSRVAKGRNIFASLSAKF